MLTTLYSKYIPFYRQNLVLAVPIMISQLGHIAVQLADSAIVGHFTDTTQLASVSLVNSVFILILGVGVGISYGLTPLIAQENGRKNYTECGKLLSNSLIINLITGILLYCLLHFGLLHWIDNMWQDPAVVRYAKPYLNYLSLSIVPLMLFLTFKQFAEGLGFTKQAMMITVIGNVINIILGIIFVKGMFGITSMGVKGVGLSTLVDRCLMALSMGIYVFYAKRIAIYIEKFKLGTFDKVRMLKILKLGTPVAMQYTFEISAFSVAGLIIGTIGAVQLAAHLTALNLASTTYMIAGGIASAATIKTGNYLGENTLQNLRLSAIASYHLIIIFMSIMAMLFIMASHILPYVFTNDMMVVRMAIPLIVIAGFFQLFDGTQVIGLGVLRGIGDVNIPTLITFISYWVVGIPSGYLMGITLKIGVTGIWYGLTLGLLVSSSLLFFRFQNRSKLLIKKSVLS